MRVTALPAATFASQVPRNLPLHLNLGFPTGKRHYLKILVLNVTQDQTNMQMQCMLGQNTKEAGKVRNQYLMP